MANKKTDSEIKTKESQKEKSVDIKKEIIDTVIYLLFLFVTVWLIITFVGQRTVVNGESMYDTLHDHDNLWVDKFSYHFKEPERFDIVVFTMYDGRTNLSMQVIENVRNNLNQTIYDTIIPRGVRLAEAPSHGLPITQYDNRSTGAKAYMALAKEVIERSAK